MAPFLANTSQGLVLFEGGARASACAGCRLTTVGLPTIHLNGPLPDLLLTGKRDGAVEWIRTTTVLLPPAPQAGASASSATTAPFIYNDLRGIEDVEIPFGDV